MSKLNGKVALVTGGGTGIGRAITEAFVAAGAKVVITGRRSGPLEQVAAAHADQVAWTQADVTSPEEAAAAVAFTRERFGRLDVLVNNAGTFLAKPLAETSAEELTWLNRVNIDGPLLVTRAAIPLLVEAKGSVINLSSTVAQGVIPGTAAYSGTKAALEQISRVLAAELGGQGVRVNALAPGLTETEMAKPMTDDAATREQMVAQTPLGRLGQPEDIARVAVFLASDEAGWVTGQALQSSGGLLL